MSGLPSPLTSAAATQTG
ncbi:unnamed protein product, partial [Rotaria magnacalcarata]